MAANPENFALCALAHIRQVPKGVNCGPVRLQAVYVSGWSYQIVKELKLQSRPFRILCTEDDLDTRDLITFVLKSNNFQVITAETPELAIEIAKDFSFDLYLVDNWMPQMSGPDLCREFRRFDNQTPILFYSGAGYENDKTAAYASGAQGYLVKPVDNDQLVAEVRRLILESQAVRTPQTERSFVSQTAAPLVQHAGTA